MILSTIIFTLTILFFLTGFQIDPTTITTTIIGSLASWGVTKLLKQWTGVYAVVAVILTYVVCVAVAVIATILSMVWNGQDLTVSTVLGQSFAIFTLATFAYQLLDKKE